MSLRDTVLAHRHDIRRAAAAHRVGRVRLFGSVARGDDRVGSDIDLIVSLAPGGTLMDLARLEVDLEVLLGCPVDLVPETGLKEPFRTDALRDAVDVCRTGDRARADTARWWKQLTPSRGTSRAVAPRSTQMRDRIAHQYWAVDDEIVWETAVDELPIMQALLTAALTRVRKLAPPVSPLRRTPE